MECTLSSLWPMLCGVCGADVRLVHGAVWVVGAVSVVGGRFAVARQMVELSARSAWGWGGGVKFALVGAEHFFNCHFSAYA